MTTETKTISLCERLGYTKLKIDDLTQDQISKLIQTCISRYSTTIPISPSTIDDPGSYRFMQPIVPADTFEKYFRDTHFKPLCAFIGDDIRSCYYGMLTIFAVTDNELYRIEFRIHTIHGSNKESNYIETITRLDIFDADWDTIVYETPDPPEEPYGFGALWARPCLKTEKQKNLHALQSSLKDWSVIEHLNRRFSTYEKKRDVKAYINNNKNRLKEI